MIPQVENLDLVRHALELRERGFLCVPLRESGKHLDLRQMGYQPVHLLNRKKSLKELAFTSIAFHLCQEPPSAKKLEHWFANDASNLGIVGGFRDLLVLDFDRLACFEQWRQKFGDLVDCTPVTKTVNGFHVYLRCQRPIPSSSLHFGFRRVGHVKALGGYVVAPPSRLLDGKVYRWLDRRSPNDVEPQWIESLESLSLTTVSPFKRHYDRLLNRGTFMEN